MNVAYLPSALLADDCWIVHRAKRPYDARTGFPASVTNPCHWSSHAEAAEALGQNDYDGPGFCFADFGGIAGIDLDKCRDPETGAVAGWAQDIVEQLCSFTEVSLSGTGLHVYVRGTVPGGGRRFGQIECYSSGRFFAITGCQLSGTPDDVLDRQAELDRLLQRLDGGRSRPTRPTPTVSTTAATTAATFTFSTPAKVVDTAARGVRQLQEVLDKALAAKNGDKFGDLWEGRWQQYSEYPSQSEADLGFATMLEYWTDGDPLLIDALFRRSALMRDKWNEPRGTLTYGQLTIQAALGRF